ncbi:MAG: aminotransferase class I/II-fold pyridoxal phosphate-dependent enzyme, partial [Candidatus Neomarinimicrobiota bacterium]
GYVETEDGFAINLESLEKSISSRTKALIYNNYQNPISAASTPEEMERIARLALKHDLWVLSDEAYFEINYLHDSRSIVSLPGMRERTVILYTFSKKFAMTGWRLGAAIGPEKLIQVISKLNINAESCSNHFIQYAGIEGILGDQSGPKQILKELEKRRDVAVNGLNSINGINLATPKSTFYLFPNVSEIGRRKGFNNVTKLQEETLHNTGVSFCTRNHFGRPLQGEKDFFIRLAYSGINIDKIEEAMAKLKDYFES